jgi:DNA-binding MarR family transcriptional regulator
MTTRKHTPAGANATALMLEVFRLNGRLLVAGDRLVARLGMTSARWQVLGAIALSPAAEPVARLARNIGLSRQGVQRIVDELRKQALVELQPNPHHRRAKLVVLTEKGRKAYQAASDLQIPWVNALAKGLDPKQIAAATQLTEVLRRRLEEYPSVPIPKFARSGGTL